MTPFETDTMLFTFSDEPDAADDDRVEAIRNISKVARDDETLETETDDKSATPVSSAKTDDLVDRYLADIRQHDLLSLEAERALWRRIEHHKSRVRRALCLSPAALPTLTRMWNQIKHGEIALQDVINLSPEDDAAWPGAQDQLSDTVAQLHHLATDLDADRRRDEAAIVSPAERNWRRRERAQWLHQWVDAWEALPLHPSIYETIRLSLEREADGQPHNRPLHAAHWAWRTSKRQLDAATAQMLQANLRLVVHVAMRFRDSNVPLLDLIQEGNIGLMRAIDKFEPSAGLNS